MLLYYQKQGKRVCLWQKTNAFSLELLKTVNVLNQFFMITPLEWLDNRLHAFAFNPKMRRELLDKIKVPLASLRLEIDESQEVARHGEMWQIEDSFLNDMGNYPTCMTHAEITNSYLTANELDAYCNVQESLTAYENLLDSYLTHLKQLPDIVNEYLVETIGLLHAPHITRANPASAEVIDENKDQIACDANRSPNELPS